MSDPVEMELLECMNYVPENRRMEVQIAYQAQKKSRTTALVLGLLFGTLGVDRFYLGQAGLGLGKLFTAGGCGVWAIIDYFLIMGAADAHNRGVLQQLMLAYRPSPAMQQLPQYGYQPYSPPQQPHGPPYPYQ